MEKTLKRNSLKKNFSWNFIGNLIYAATQWGLIIVLTRLGSVEMVGLFSLGLAISGPIIMFTNLQLRTVQATSNQKKAHFSNFIAVRIISNIFFCLALIIIILLSDYDVYTAVIIGLVAFSKLIESFSDISYGLFQQQERMEFISKSEMMRGIYSLIAVSILIYLTSDLIIALIGLIICWLLVFIFYDIKNIHRFSLEFKADFNKKKVINIIKVSLPLGIVVMIVSLNSNLPKVLVEDILGIEALGYFSSISYLVFVGSKFINSIGNAMLPRLASLYDKGRNVQFRKNLMLLLVISIVIGLSLLGLSYVAGEYILYVIYGSKFVTYKTLFVLIMIYGTFNYLSYSLMIGLNATKNFKIQPYLGIVWLFASIASLLYFTPRYGLNGAAISLIIYSLSRVFSISIVLYWTLKMARNTTNLNR